MSSLKDAIMAEYDKWTGPVFPEPKKLFKLTPDAMPLNYGILNVSQGLRVQGWNRIFEMIMALVVAGPVAGPLVSPHTYQSEASEEREAFANQLLSTGRLKWSAGVREALKDSRLQAVNSDPAGFVWDIHGSFPGPVAPLQHCDLSTAPAAVIDPRMKELVGAARRSVHGAEFADAQSLWKALEDSKGYAARDSILFTAINAQTPDVRAAMIARVFEAYEASLDTHAQAQADPHSEAVAEEVEEPGDRPRG